MRSSTLGRLALGVLALVVVLELAGSILAGIVPWPWLGGLVVGLCAGVLLTEEAWRPGVRMRWRFIDGKLCGQRGRPIGLTVEAMLRDGAIDMSFTDRP